MSEELRILLVEDDSSDAELIRRELRKAHIQFSSTCVDNEKAFQIQLDEFCPHIVISDFALGQFNALKALQLLQARSLDLPFILVTGSQSEEVAVACIKEGADDYILKSSLKRLPSAVLSALKKKDAEKDRERAEDALRRSEESFRSLIENSNDIIAIIRPDGEIYYISPSVERVLGYHPAEVMGRNVLDFVHAEDVADVRRRLKERNHGPGSSVGMEFRFRHRDGFWRILEALGRNMLDRPGVEGFIINSRDITERKHAEEQIREQAALLDKAKDAIFVHDLDNRITFWNKSAEDLYGWGASEVLGRNVVDLIQKRDSDAVQEAWSRVLETDEWAGELRQFGRHDREITVESRWTLLRDGQGHPRSLLVINTDVTEKKKLESQFLRAQRMESIGTMAGGIAHDLNNVLTPILLAIRMLRDEIQDSGMRDILNTLETSAQRGSGIVQQILSFARGVEGERSVFQVRHPLMEIVNIAKDTFPRSIHVVTRIDKDLWPIVGDPTQLHQVFMNLCVNARDAMPHGGRLQIDATNINIDEHYARMQPEAKAGPYVVVTISDTGVGIPAALMEKIFEPFFTTKEVGKGTGLGLSTVAGIVKSHGGFLNVYSEVGKGTRFRVHLPAAESVDRSQAGEPDLELPRGSGEVILIADDEYAIREIVRVTLEGNGYSVLSVNDGTEAVAFYAQQKDDIRAVIVDVMMPYMDGPATMRALQKLNPEVRLIAMSGLMDNDKVAEIATSHRMAFLAKPFTTEQLLLALRRLLNTP